MDVTADKIRMAADRHFLKQSTIGASSAPLGFLLFDSIAAILFAAGLAGGVVAVPEGLAGMAPWALLALLGSLLRSVAVTLAARSGAARAGIAKSRLRGRIVGIAFRHPPGGSSTVGVLMNAVVDEVEAIDGYIARFLPARHAAALGPLLILAATACASPIAAAILVLTLFPFIVAMALAGGAAADESRRQFEALSRLSHLFADRIRALPLVLAFRVEASETARIGRAADEVAKRTLKVLRVAFLSSGALEFFAALSVALVAVYAGFNLLGLLPFPVPEKLDLFRAFFVLALAPEFYAPMRRLAAAYHDRQAADTAAGRLRSVEEHGPEVAAQELPVGPGAPAISFRNVSICYAGSAGPAVSDFCLEIASGETVALVGPSGSGKSSLLHILLGLAPLTAGKIFVGDTAIEPGGSIAPLAAWVGQSPLILPGTIRDNIAMSKPDASREEIAAAVRAAGLGHLLLRRRCGLDGRLDERGGGLSGGERRRIALARALLKQAPLLLLDEPTAHLDSAAEAELIGSIGRALPGRTAIIATHSEALAGTADRIVRLGAPA
ncbi:ATP-binding cassette subfamily C protein CydD [Sphingomonas sp. BE270]|jgi:ATP-binding cassette subfamily C protein CydD|uniref:thiol reductant ABC exporter subunit CydD n=1 Tax=Sphingomonas sp. BE270 TaxID=2817726 RepID=UPI002862B4C8|nr:thiol reductant ABC exporter subunit CydD [Sphingomonas sp. BE270]MDR7256421.1 ATP-binding cassette subfamily C protein CydD [Sphingomonas sp. BE270]